MTRPRMAAALLLLLVSGCEGCTVEDIADAIGAQFPTVGRVAALNPIHEVPFQVTAELTAPANPESQVGVYEVRATMVSRADPGFTASIVLAEDEAAPAETRFTGEMPGLPLGRYDLEVEFALQWADEAPAEGGLVLEQNAIVDVNESDACFTFAVDQEDAPPEGWTVDGVWDIVPTASEPDGTLNAVLPGPTCSLFAYQGQAMAGVSACFPSGTTEPQSGVWALDFVSPELGDNPAWDDAVGVAFTFRVDGQSPGAGGDVQPIVRMADGGTVTRYAPGQAGNRIFYPLGQGFYQWPWGDGVPGGVAGGRVRVFVAPMDLPPTAGFVAMGAYCPITGP